jgi:S-adenosyl-L-methionine hydrolase (adenosine-forming)
VTRPIALLTDFGYKDAYVGVMKGVILSRFADAKIWDLTHDIPAQHVLAGALQLQSAVPYSPEETVFLAVVDPGVGSERRPICIQSGTTFFVGPDNGLLWLAACTAGAPRAFVLDRSEYWLPDCGSTFHGRDLFAPVAAALGFGMEPEDLGTPIDDPVTLEFPEPTFYETSVVGQVLFVDGFGNAVTNLLPEHTAPHETFIARAGSAIFHAPVSHYAAVEPGEPAFLVGSLGYYEVAINGGSAARELDLETGSLISLVLSA